MALDVLGVAEERVRRREEDGEGHREQELGTRDDRHQEQPCGDPVAEEEVDDRQGDHPEGEADGLGHDRRRRQDDLRELDLADQLLAGRHRLGRVGEAGGEPLPGQDRREHEQRVVGGLAGEDHRHEDDVDGHLEEGVEDPPELAEQRVGVGALEVRADEVSGQASPPDDLRRGRSP